LDANICKNFCRLFSNSVVLMPSADSLKHQILDMVRQYVEEVHGDPTQTTPFTPGQPVPVSGRVFGQSEVVNLVDSALEFWLTTGRYNQQFEEALAKFVGVRHALTCNSGSSANLLAVTALTSPILGDKALKAGDEVITCATGFPTTINPILQNNLVPVFVDVDIPTYNIDVSQLEQALSERTRAIVIAHALGNPFNLNAVMAFAKQHNLFVIEDTCDALGASYNGQNVGTFGDIATLSFYPAHHITMGEGGAVLTNNAQLRKALESIRDWGRDCWCPPGKDNTCNNRFAWQLGDLPTGYDHKYTYSHVGYNLKITDMQAAIGLAQLERLPGFITKRITNFNHMLAGMQAFASWFVLPEATPNSQPSWFGFPLTVKPSAPFTRDELLIYLNERQIGTRLLFAGNLIRQPYMKNQSYRVVGKLDCSDKVMKQTFWLGVYPGLDHVRIQYILDSIHAFCQTKTAVPA
jgi:CDP-4-dehydro-6-deoxyglucose reductase, E1